MKTITNIPDIDALPTGAVILDSDGDPWLRGPLGWTCTDRASNTVDQPGANIIDIYGPVTLIHDPSAVIEITTDEQLEEFIESATEASYFASERNGTAYILFCSVDGDWYATRPPHEEDPKTEGGDWLGGVTLSVDSLTLPIAVIDPRDPR